MDEEKKYEKIKHDIFPLKTLSNTLGVIATLATIYLAVLLLKGVHILIAVLVLIVIVLTVFLIKISLRLRYVLTQYNSQIDKLREANDNRSTLEKMIKKKNNEIDIQNNELATVKAQGRLLFGLMYSDERPNREDLKDSLRIEQDGVINSER